MSTAPSTPAVKLRSRLAARLDSEIAAAANIPVRVSVLEVQRAILWLRHGRESEAREALNALYARLLLHPRAELAAWLHLAQGLMAYFGPFSDFGGDNARDRVRRARVMAVAAGLRPLQAHADAWLAHMGFMCRDLDGLITHAQASLAALTASDHGAAYRVATALALAWSHASGEAAATPWYAWARQHAIAEGDDAAMAALLYNQTVRRALRIRHAALAGEPGEAPAVLLGVASIDHFDDAVGGSARGDLTPLLRAQLLTVQGDFAEAAALLQAQLPTAMAAGLARVGCSLLADLAWCWVNTGEMVRARALADQAAIEAQAENEPSCDVDERAALHARLAQVYSRLHEPGLAARQAEAAAQAWAQDAAQRVEWTARLRAAGLGTPPR